MNDNEALFKRIIELESQYEKNQIIRTIAILVGYAVLPAVFLFLRGTINSIKDIVISVIACIVFSGFCFFVNHGIFLWYFSKNQEENELLYQLKEKYRTNMSNSIGQTKYN